jgi:hypothetical protein
MSMRAKISDWRAARKAAREDRRNKKLWANLSNQPSDLARAQAAQEAKQHQIAEEQTSRIIQGLDI